MCSTWNLSFFGRDPSGLVVEIVLPSWKVFVLIHEGKVRCVLLYVRCGWWGYVLHKEKFRCEWWRYVLLHEEKFRCGWWGYVLLREEKFRCGWWGYVLLREEKFRCGLWGSSAKKSSGVDGEGMCEEKIRSGYVGGICTPDCQKPLVFKLSFAKIVAVGESGQPLESEWWSKQKVCYATHSGAVHKRILFCRYPLLLCSEWVIGTCEWWQPRLAWEGAAGESTVLLILTKCVWEGL